MKTGVGGRVLASKLDLVQGNEQAFLSMCRVPVVANAGRRSCFSRGLTSCSSTAPRKGYHRRNVSEHV